MRFSYTTWDRQWSCSQCSIALKFSENSFAFSSLADRENLSLWLSLLTQILWNFPLLHSRGRVICYAKVSLNNLQIHYERERPEEWWKILAFCRPNIGVSIDPMRTIKLHYNHKNYTTSNHSLSDSFNWFHCVSVVFNCYHDKYEKNIFLQNQIENFPKFAEHSHADHILYTCLPAWNSIKIS